MKKKKQGSLSPLYMYRKNDVGDLSKSIDRFNNSVDYSNQSQMSTSGESAGCCEEMYDGYTIQTTQSGVIVRDNKGKFIQEFDTEPEAYEFIDDTLLNEGFKDMTLRESLNYIDNYAIDHGTKFYDVRSLVENANLSYEEKNTLKGIIDDVKDTEEAGDVVMAFLASKDENTNESLEEDIEADPVVYNDDYEEIDESLKDIYDSIPDDSEDNPCEGCMYIDREESEYPCEFCRRIAEDCYEPGFTDIDPEITNDDYEDM